MKPWVKVNLFKEKFVKYIGFIVTFFLPVAVYAGEKISIVGSSTVFPFSASVSEEFGRKSTTGTPVLESTGTGGGFKLFCEGVGKKHPDINNASRAMKSSEKALCKKNGIQEVVEVLVGYDGIAIANSIKSPDFDLSRKEIFLALSKQVPNEQGKLIDNPYTKWNQISSSLPDTEIKMFGPPPTSGTRDAFVELVMRDGCKEVDYYKDFDKKAIKAHCSVMREDGVYIDAGENDNLIVQKLETNRHALGILGFSFLEQSSDKIKGSAIEGVRPDFENIASGDYKVSRSLFFYVKKDNVKQKPSLAGYVTEFMSEDASGEDGYLVDIGLIPLSDDQRDETIKRLTDKGLIK